MKHCLSRSKEHKKCFCRNERSALLFLWNISIQILGFVFLYLCRSILHILLYLWSYSPILCLSHDENFCEIKGGIKNKTNLRFSLINLYLGRYFCSIFTFSIRSTEWETFHLFKFLTINEAIRKSNHSPNRSLDDYKILSDDKEEIAVKKEAAYYESQRWQAAVSVTQNKINNILSIGLAIISIAIPVIIPYIKNRFSVIIGYGQDTNFKLIPFFCNWFSTPMPSVENIQKGLAILLIIVCALFVYSFICVLLLILKNLDRESIEKASIEYASTMEERDLVAIIRKDTASERNRSLVLTTSLIQIKKSMRLLILFSVLLSLFNFC